MLDLCDMLEGTSDDKTGDSKIVVMVGFVYEYYRVWFLFHSVYLTVSTSEFLFQFLHYSFCLTVSTSQFYLTASTLQFLPQFRHHRFYVAVSTSKFSPYSFYITLFTSLILHHRL